VIYSGTRTRVNKFTTTRNTNPLEPEYQTPKVEFVPFPEPKFIRDNMAIDVLQSLSRISKESEVVRPSPTGFKNQGKSSILRLKS
jgi:hypothetical protein